ncbi:MAG: ABC transporter permease subunit [Verrucomicrobiales bacterium]|nr:ABC transporter permease subunit [Verrucomicrobiales bacterium]
MIRFLVRRTGIAIVRLIAMVLVLGTLTQFSLWLLDEPRQVWQLAGSFDSAELADFSKRSIASFRVLAICWTTVVIFGLMIGILSARFRQSRGMKLFWMPFMVASWVPAFWLVCLAALWLLEGWGHPGFADGEAPVRVEGLNQWWHASLLGVILAAGAIGFQYRICREGIIRRGTQQEFIRSSFMRGHRRSTIFYDHILKNSMPALTGVIDRGLPATLGMLAVSEWAFRYPGLGQFLVEGARLGMPEAVFLTAVVFSGVVILVTLLAEWIHGILDRRIRTGPYPIHY